MTSFYEILEYKLTKLKKENLLRKIVTFDSINKQYVTLNGEIYLLFSGSNYLSLSYDLDLKIKLKNAIDNFGIGSEGSRLISGTLKFHNSFEKELAEFCGSDASVIFNSGYMANLSIFSCLSNEKTIIFSDELNHRSIIDGIKLSKSKAVIYKHSSISDLLEKIEKFNIESASVGIEKDKINGIIVTDGIFSIDGDIAKIPEIYEICKEKNFLLVIDDAHSIGVIGKGSGTINYFNLPFDDNIIVSGSLSKAFGIEGGYILGSEPLCKYLKNTAKTFIYTTSQPFFAAIGPDIIRKIQNENLTEKLRSNIKYAKDKLLEYGIKIFSDSAIISILIGDEKKALIIENELFKRKIILKSVKYPTVKKNQAKLRLTITLSHTKEDIDLFIEQLSCVLKNHS